MTGYRVAMSVTAGEGALELSTQKLGPLFPVGEALGGKLTHSH